MPRQNPLVPILAAAFSVRLLAVAALDARRLPNTDLEPWAHARSVFAGHGYGFDWYGLLPEPVAGSFIPPLYPGILTGLLFVTGGRTEAAVLLAQVLNILWGTLTVLLVALIARRIAPVNPAALPGGDAPGLRGLAERVRRDPGLLAAVLWAFYPPALGHAYAAGSQTLEAFLLVLLAWTVLRSGLAGTPGPARSVPVTATLTGLVLGLMLLERSTVALIWIVWCLVLLGRHRFRAPARRFVILSSAAAFLVLSPWAIRNWSVHGAFVPVSTNGGFNFYMGNNPDTGGDIPEVGLTFHYMSEAERETWRSLSEVERDARFYGMGLDYWRDQPGDALKSLLYKIQAFVLFRSYLFAGYPPWISWGFAVSYLAILALFLAGLPRGRDPGSRLLLFAILVTGVVSVVYIVSMRFRYTVEPFMVVIGARWLSGSGQRPDRTRR